MSSFIKQSLALDTNREPGQGTWSYSPAGREGSEAGGTEESWAGSDQATVKQPSWQAQDVSRWQAFPSDAESQTEAVIFNGHVCLALSRNRAEGLKRGPAEQLE